MYVVTRYTPTHKGYILLRGFGFVRYDLKTPNKGYILLRAFGCVRYDIIHTKHGVHFVTGIRLCTL